VASDLGSDNPDTERTFRAFLLALRRRPGIKLTFLSLCGFGAIVAVKNGVLALLAAVAVALLIGLPLGYRSFRRTGHV
jgi:hypothetical protein